MFTLNQNGCSLKTRTGVHFGPEYALSKAVENIAGKSEEIGATSLFSRGGTILSASSSQNVNDFEVVSYMVIL